MIVPENCTTESNVLLWCLDTMFPVIHVGSYPTRNDVSLLLKAGVDTFINLCTEKENSESYDYTEDNNNSLECYNIPIKYKSVPTKKDICTTMNIILKSLERGKAVYIHSMSGRGRVNTLACHVYKILTECKNHKLALYVVLERYATRSHTEGVKAIESGDQYASILNIKICDKKVNKQKL